MRLIISSELRSKGGTEPTMTFLAMLLWLFGGKFGGLSNDGFWIFTAICLLITTVDVVVPRNLNKNRKE